MPTSVSEESEKKSLAKDAIGHVRHERDRFVAFAFTSADLLIECTADGHIQYVSGVIKRLGTDDASTLIGKPLQDYIHDQDKLFFDSLIENAWRTGRVRPVTIRLHSETGQDLTPVMRCMRYGDSIYLAFVINPVMRGESMAQSVETDEQTGLMTKDSFMDRAAAQLKSGAAAGGDRRLTMMELDGLSSVAEENADLAQEINQNVGALLRSWSSGGNSAGHIGEDRFGLVSDGSVDTAQLEKLMESYKSKIATDIKLQKIEVDMDSADMSEEDAARALMFAINEYSSTNDVTNFSMASLEEGAKKHLSTARDRVARMRKILEQRNFVMAFQPIVNLTTGELHHYEALARLQGDESPYEMVTFAEKVGMILDLDIMIARRIAEMLDEERRKGHKPHVAMNVSARSLQSNLFVDSFRRTMAEFPDVLSQIAVEITETAQIGELAGFNSVIQTLREDGHEVSMDDVGTGTTSFETLREINVDFAKIDGMYVQQSMNNEKDKAVLESMVSLCKALNFSVIGEMVETVDQVNHLKSIGVQYGQGYYFGAPVNGSYGLQWPFPDPDAPKISRSRAGVQEQFS